MTPILSARGLDVRAGAKTLVSQVDIDVWAGRLTAICGPNGAGKSSLLKALSGERRPDSGQILIAGRDLARLRPEVLACHRAVLPQSSDIHLPLTGREIVTVGVRTAGSADKGRLIVAACLARAGVADLADRVYQTLSGGERQRIQFARALAQLEAGRSHAPSQVLLLDEPTASLDIEHQIAVLQEARALCDGGLAVLAVLHDLQAVRTYADEVLVMHQGRVRACGVPASTLSASVLRSIFSVELKGDVLPELPYRRRQTVS